MSLDFTYQPLRGDEIRLLKIEVDHNRHGRTNTTKHHPIACSIEHVRLPRTLGESSNQQFKGADRTWPELSTQQNFGPLFSSGEDTHVDKIALRNSEHTSIAGESALPWRRPWGDYIALSYVWSQPTGSNKEERFFITVNGCPFKVTPNLYHALRELQKSQRVRQGFKLWIDAICIDQSNSDERGQQVSRMRDIYQSAWQVLIWLGPSDTSTQLAFSALHWLSRESKQPKPMEDFYREGPSVDLRPVFIMWPTYTSPMKKDVYKALYHFFTRPYWRRMWVVQEVAMGNPNSPVLCGDHCISWQDIYQAVQVITSDESRFGREILDSVQPQTLSTWSFEVARDRQIRGRNWAPERMWKVQETMMYLQEDQRTFSSASGWKELIRALSLARDALITDEKDRVYGILGIKAVADRVNIKPEYNLSQSTIYSNFAKEIMKKGDLNLLRLASGHGGYVLDSWEMDDLPASTKSRAVGALTLPILNATKGRELLPVGVSCNHDIPSWSVCWECTPAPTAQLGGIYKADAHLGRSLPIFSRGRASLTTKGVVLDTITSLSASHEKDSDPRYPCNTHPPYTSYYGDFEETRDAFWRTIVGDTTLEGGETAPEECSWLLEPRLWQRGIAGVWTNGFGLHSFMARNASLEICGFTIQELIFGRNKFKSKLKSMMGENFYHATEFQRESLSWAVNAMAWRRVFGTRWGRMGMGSCAAEVGDSIVLLRGCNTPLILRSSGEAWKLVGECYVHGVMYGEVSSEEHGLEDITIY
ncbi:hypothetical protein FPOAC2_04184 [Fusarium poae]|jgi:hypothetical protein|uniref:hypothetical protein n=1 Tax=Fusarium poae TaxID=36050 RepID=UPI001CE89BF7|nr:hypothetical protein FPOAC1_004112 [Fusarium poae]KAG8670878.1 hypothetical protein FPOAC1_004112 [Fusarium poae]